MLSQIQGFGGAMFTPVLLFPFARIVVGLAICNQVNHLIPTRVLVKGGEITCKMLK